MLQRQPGRFVGPYDLPSSSCFIPKSSVGTFIDGRTRRPVNSRKMPLPGSAWLGLEYDR